jgi:hypothetical protein
MKSLIDHDSFLEIPPLLKKKALDKNWSIPYNEFKKEVEVL